MADYFEDPETGKVYRKSGERYVEVSPAAADTGALEAAAIGAGSTLTGLARGAQMRLGQALGNRELYYGTAEKAWADERPMAELSAERPFSTGAGAIAPYFAAPVAGGVIGGAVANAALGALSPTQDPSSGMYLGAAAGAAGGFASMGLARAARARGLVGGADEGIAGAAPGAAPVTRAERVRGAIQARGAALRAADEPLGGGGLEDLAAAGRRADLEDATVIAQGGAPEAARAARAAQLGYDPALLGGRAMTRDPGEVHRWAVRRADELGFELTPGQMVDSAMIRKLESAGRSTPWASAPFDAMQAKNQGVFNRIVNRALGQEGDEVTLSTMNRAQDWVDEQFTRVTEAIRARGGMPAGGLQSKLDDIRAEWQGYGVALPENMVERFKRPDGTFDPQGILGARQKVSQLIRQAKSTGQTTSIEPLSKMVEAIDDAVSAAARSAGKGTFAGREVDSLKQAREVYRLLIALDRPGVWKEEKNVLMGPMYRALKSGYRGEMRGRKEPSSPAMRDLVDAVRVREAAMKELVNDSGTATRLSLQNLGAMNTGAAAAKLAAYAPAAAYLQLGKVGQRTLTAQGAEQLRGIWGSAW